MVKLDRTNKKEKQVNFRIDEKSLTRVKKIALKKKISFSELIRLSVESYIKKWLVNVLKNIEVKEKSLTKFICVI